MRRPSTLALLAVTALLTAGLAGCAPGPDRRPEVGRPAGNPGPASTGPVATPAAPAPPPGAAPAGAFAVGIRSLDLERGDRPLPVTVWYPGTGESGGAPRRAARVAGGRFPVVLFSHGLTALPADYAALLTRWVAAGFVVAAPAFPHTSRNAPDFQALDVINQPADASYVLTRVLALDNRDGDPLRGHLATDRVAAAGHSAGGITTVGLFTAARDERLDAGMVFAGSALGMGTAFSGPAAPQLFVHGQLDDVVSYAAGRAVYDRVPWPKAMLSLPDGDHGRSMLRRGAPTLGVVADATVEFLRWTLYGDPAAKRRLPEQATAGGLARWDDRL